MTIDHDRCSELIAPFVRGELDERAAAEVREHLDGCDACSAEERGVRALLAAQTEPPMSELERVRMHRQLENAVVAERGREAKAPRRKEAGARIAALGAAAAAVLLVVGGFLYLGLGGGSDSEMGAAQRADEGGGSAEDAGGQRSLAQ